MAKNLDSIKKLNPEDVKKYRKIVLNYIGEKDSSGIDEQKNINQPASKLREVDGIKLNKTNRRESEIKAAQDKLAVKIAGMAESRRREEENRLKEAIRRQEGERERIKEEERLYRQKKGQEEKMRREQEETNKREEQRKKAVAEQAGREEEEKKRIEKIRQDEEKMKLKEQEKEEARRVKENMRLEEMKRQEEIKKVKQEIKIAKQMARAKARARRWRALRKYFKNFNQELKGTYLAIRQNIIYIIAFSVLFLAIIYIVFCLFILRLKINNNIIDRAAAYIPVPAVIASQGIISFNDFQKIEDKNYFSLNLAEKKDYLAKWLILRNLERKYGQGIGVSNNDLALKYVLDKDFNQVGLSRINKISELLKGQGGIERFGKYADEYHDGVYYDGKSATEKFGPTILGLAIGRSSNIISQINGYYIVERIDDKNGQLGLKYLFVKAQTIDQYISEKLEKIKVFILAN